MHVDVNYDTTQSSTQIYFYTFGYIPGSFFTYQYLRAGAYNVSDMLLLFINTRSICLCRYMLRVKMV